MEENYPLVENANFLTSDTINFHLRVTRSLFRFYFCSLEEISDLRHEGCASSSCTLCLYYNLDVQCKVPALSQNISAVISHKVTTAELSQSHDRINSQAGYKILSYPFLT